MAKETRLERGLERQLARATTPRGAAIVIGVVSTAITLLAGVLMTVIDHDNFPSIGGGLWWAVQTVTTVGYGDHVPTNSAGRLMAALVMLLGIGFITVITASITGTFVQHWQQGDAAAVDADSAAAAAHLQSIDARLERIEAALEARD